MPQTQMSSISQVLSPTLHLYHYALRNGLNESSEILEKRREKFNQHLQEFTSQLTISSGKKANEVVKLISSEKELSEIGNILDLSNIPEDCKPTNGANHNLIYLDDGTVSCRLAVGRLHDTYLLRFTSFVSSRYGNQHIDRFGDFPPITKLPIEVGQTVILAGIIPKADDLEVLPLAVKCLISYYGKQENIESSQLIKNKFLDSPFFIYKQPIIVEKNNKYTIASIRLSCVFLYKDEQAEKTANKVYPIFQDLLLSYHKINFSYSQSLALKKRLSQLYQKIEELTEKYHEQKWDSESLKQLPQNSLEYWKNLSFLEDQARAIDINSKSYKERLQQIEKDLEEKAPEFFIEFEKDIAFYLDQIKSNIGFLSPGIQLYEKLMLSVQTQVSIDDATLQKQQNQRQVKLGQLLTGSCAAIAIGQILYEPIKTTVSQRVDEGGNQISIQSLWYGAGLTIIFSVCCGYLLSKLVYQWFTKEKF